MSKAKPSVTPLLTSEPLPQPEPANLPALSEPILAPVHATAGDRLIREWLGEAAPEAQIIRTNIATETDVGMATITRLLLDSPHDNLKLDSREFTLVGYLLTVGSRVDNETGEVTTWPRIALACQDGSHLVFGGKVAFKSVLLLACKYTPERWRAGLKVRVHAKKSQLGGLMHRLEVLA